MNSGDAPIDSRASNPFWVSVFLDFAPETYDAGVMHWVLLTGYGLSAPRGANREFATLLPNDGDPIVSDADAFVRVQRLAPGPERPVATKEQQQREAQRTCDHRPTPAGPDSPSRIHLDLHVEDAAAAASRAEALGATQVADHGYRVMRSPGGLPFCFVTTPASRRPAPTGWRAGHHSLLDQVCIDIPDQHWERESAFWSALTGWVFGTSRFPDSFLPLQRPHGQPIRLLLQRLGEPAGDVRAHLDWSTTDREAEVERHLTAGSTMVARHSLWTVMRGPGTTYCITDRDPATGLVP